MIRSFKDKETQRVYRREFSRQFDAIKRQALKKLLILNNAKDLTDLLIPPGNHLEALKGNRAGQHAIRINDQWRICFAWQEGAHEVEICDYH